MLSLLILQHCLESHFSWLKQTLLQEMYNPAIGDRMNVKGLQLTMPWETAIWSTEHGMAQALPSRYLRQKDHASLTLAIADSALLSELSGPGWRLCPGWHARNRLAQAGRAGALPGVDKCFVLATCALFSLSKAL